MSLEIPLALGVVGGLTQNHPLASEALSLLNHPDARTLMGIASSVGLASNFSAVKSIITSGIQKGHMRMHLSNMLNRLNVSQDEKLKAEQHFRNKKINYSLVYQYITDLRMQKNF